MMPPIDPPVAARPVAEPRFRAKKWAIAEMAGVKMREEPRPHAMEKEMMKCQYSNVVRERRDGVYGSR